MKFMDNYANISVNILHVIDIYLNISHTKDNQS